MLCMYTQVKLLVAADMGDVKETLNTSAFDTYDPSTKLWSQAIPCPIPPPHTQTQIRSKFTIASCQFAMHYMFQDIQRANHFFQQVSSNLQLGGVLIATTVDARVVADLAVKVDSEAKSGSGEYHKDLSIYADRVEDDEDLNIKNKKKSNVAAKSDDVSHPPGPLMMNIHFDEQNWNKLLNNTTNTVNSSLNRTQHIKTETPIDTDPDTTEKDPFGIRYVFTLVDDPAKGNAVDAPEWLVPTGAPLRDLAAQHGLEIDLCQNFHDFVYDKMTTDPSLR